eukprot:gnl/MRDRNA2_/MRDRNA2_101898_c0_seq1.p1 gnl/MRDRNA2_/MRDRNA2_101898_c0~~gnl/MRDRNA2_/MRDRNA2_101898_c0_seq1.p1  ORF type:complete len:128 (+),score=13.20 gnl/MRDRNA2_/MRDRNA2_101898_c0_seq1:113-496(+)
MIARCARFSSMAAVSTISGIAGYSHFKLNTGSSSKEMNSSSSFVACELQDVLPYHSNVQTKLDHQFEKLRFKRFKTLGESKTCEFCEQQDPGATKCFVGDPAKMLQRLVCSNCSQSKCRVLLSPMGM